METSFVRTYPAAHTRRYHRVAHAVSFVGPAIAAAGLIWAILQPWRLTLLHPHGQGIWWLLSEPPLYVVAVGLLFRLLLAPSIVEDIELSEH